jgi:hypothetical protein
MNLLRRDLSSRQFPVVAVPIPFLNVAVQGSRPASPPIHHLRPLGRCCECGHSVGGHVVFPNPELARWLRIIHGGCLNCVACAED